MIQTGQRSTMNGGEKILGVEGGGTKTSWVLVEHGENELRVLDQGKLPPANFRLATPDQLRSMFGELPKEITRAGIFLAGCGTEEDRHSLARLCAEIWPAAKIVTGSDRDSGLAAALGHADGIAVNAGSGSSVTGRRGDKIEKAGGWGHILGDAGGGYVLSLQALRLILREYDLHRGEVQFTTKILRALSLNNLDELVRWAQTADKMELAMLTPVVFEAAAAGDSRVMEIIEEGARVLCEYTEAVATRLHVLAPKVVLLGGLFQRDSIYNHAFRRRLKKTLPDARVANSERAPEFGAAWLAAEMPSWPEIHAGRAPEKIDDLAAALTEQRNPRSANLEAMNSQDFVKLFVDEEKFVGEALRAVIVDLARAIEVVAESLRKGGRLFYVGAGSSGRLGALDASEIPPTFGASPELVQGITASGRTPFVLGALARAKSLGAKTILLSCNPARDRKVDVDLAIDLAVGPEILTGSTRLKAGTATKIALNIISTGVMVALGKVRGNLMIDLNTSSTKLRDRATRMVADLTQCDYNLAQKQLEESGWDLRAVLKKAGQ